MTCLCANQDNYVPVHVNSGVLEISLLVVKSTLDVVFAVDKSMEWGI